MAKKEDRECWPPFHVVVLLDSDGKGDAPDIKKYENDAVTIYVLQL